MIENHRDIQVDISEENKNAGAYIIIDKVLDIVERFDAEVEEIYAFTPVSRCEDGEIEFFIDAGGSPEEYGDDTIKIAKAIEKELKLSTYLGQEDYGCLDMLQIDNNPYSSVERLKNMDKNKITKIENEIDEFVAEIAEKYNITFSNVDWDFNDEI